MGAALLAEYGGLLSREPIWRKAQLTGVERDTFLDIFLSICQWTRIYYAWPPNLGDEWTITSWNWLSLGKPTIS
jgi:hypothetical protein